MAVRVFVEKALFAVTTQVKVVPNRLVFLTGIVRLLDPYTSIGEVQRTDVLVTFGDHEPVSQVIVPPGTYDPIIFGCDKFSIGVLLLISDDFLTVEMPPSMSFE